MGMDRQALAKRIREVALLTGQFTLRSGATSTFYWDKYRFESDPVLLAAVAVGMLPLLPASYDKLAGLELGGIPLATALSLQSGKPGLYVRKAAKPYGTARLAEGADVAGKRILVVEDVVTSGGQVISSTGELRALGAHVREALCVIDRQEGGAEALAAYGIALSALLTRADLDAG